MKIEDLKTIMNNYNNLEILEIVKYSLGMVINNIALDYNEKSEYDLGNNYIIKNDDLESLVSITETIDDIIKYNK